MPVSAPAPSPTVGSRISGFASARPARRGRAVLVVAAAAMVATLPARTQGLGLITEPMLADLGIARVSFAELNLWATLIGSLFAIGVGPALDRLGSRVVLTGVALALGSAVCWMSRAQSFGALAVWITLTRGLGQSALSVVSIAMVGQWFVRRIDRAMAVYSVILSVGFMAAFPLVDALVVQRGWRFAWFALGCALLAGLAPLALWVVRRAPEVCGAAPDGEAILDQGRGRAVFRGDDLPGYSWSAALLTPCFWVFALGAALYGLVASGIGLFNENILAEHGFSRDLYVGSLVVTAFTGLAGNFLGGWLAGRVALGRLLSGALLVLAGSLAALPLVTNVAELVLWAAAMGLSGGFVMVLFFSVWPRAYGRRKLGRIQGSAQAITVLASAVGPLLLEWTRDRSGSYAVVFEALALVIAALAAAALVVRVPGAGAAPVST